VKLLYSSNRYRPQAPIPGTRNRLEACINVRAALMEAVGAPAPALIGPREMAVAEFETVALS
jgi:hypothetical protein